MRVLFLDQEAVYADQLPAGLRQVGCEVKVLTEVLHGQLEQELTRFHPDFVLTMGWSWFATEPRLKVIRQCVDAHKIPLVYWATEDPCWHERWSVPYVQRVKPDLVATICKEYVPRYEAMGLRAIALPFGYNHELFQTVAPRPGYTCDIAIVANFYTADYYSVNRRRSLEDLVTPLLTQGHRVMIWGNNWHVAPQFGVPVRQGMWYGYLHHKEAPVVYNSAKIVIGLQNEFDYETNLTMRTCEVMGAGGFLLTSRTKAISSFFEERKHLVASSSAAETLALVKHYLAHPEERAEIAAAGQAFVRMGHTYADRAVKLLLPVLARGGEVRSMEAESEPVVTLLHTPYCDCCHSDHDQSGSASDHQTGSHSPDQSGSSSCERSDSHSRSESGSPGSDSSGSSDGEQCGSMGFDLSGCSAGGSDTASGSSSDHSADE
ncbi:MAG TPA: glycosyltransferase [Symbiobacteriaceae bacterium]|nr:glycosyltransferase [Symbiobacteriaceae bacterium]